MADLGLYEPLESETKDVRLLTIKPGDGDGDVHCSLEIVSLLDEPNYETVSYVWGDPDVRATIHVNGRPIDVPATSEAVLRRMRLSDENRTIWVDAVCINQADLNERGQQVGMMDLIYENTQKNLIWLGPDNGNAEAAFDAIGRVLSDARNETNDFKDFVDTLFDYSEDNVGNVRYSTSPMSLEVDLGALQELYSNPWFGRKWVLQEAALAPHSLCHYGDQTLPILDALRAAAWLAFKIDTLGLESASWLSRAHQMFGYVDPQYGCWTPLWGWRVGVGLLDFLQTGIFSTSDPKDSVFGIIGLYKKYRRSIHSSYGLPDFAVSPNYNQPLEDLYAAAATFISREKGSLSFLSFVESCLSAAGDDGDKFPSWAPQWHRHRVRTYGIYSNHWAAGHEVEHRIRPTGAPGAKILATSGWLITTISETTSIENPPKAQIDIYLAAKSLINSGDEVHRNIRHTKLAITLSAGVNFHRKPIDLAEAANLYEGLRKFVQREDRMPQFKDYAHLDLHHPDRLAAEYHDLVMGFNRQRRVFSTVGPAIGLGPLHVRPGDVVVALYGLRWPAILRPRRDLSYSHFKLVGTCYIHEIMDGTLAEEYRAAGGEDVTFNLV